MRPRQAGQASYRYAGRGASRRQCICRKPPASSRATAATKLVVGEAARRAKNEKHARVIDGDRRAEESFAALRAAIQESGVQFRSITELPSLLLNKGLESGEIGKATVWTPGHAPKPEERLRRMWLRDRRAANSGDIALAYAGSSKMMKRELEWGARWSRRD